MTSTHIQVRDARDRLIDLLGLGQTYPLQDLAVRDEQLTVAFNTPAKIPIENSQKDVLYQLYHDHKLAMRKAEGEGGARVPIQAQGTGETILLETDSIQDDITFQILASKPGSGREAYLHQAATVKVGLDTALRARIRDAPYLNPAIENPTDITPRIIQYGLSVAVEIEHSQEGVDYRLVAFQAIGSDRESKEVLLSTADVRGDLGSIVLRTQPIREDTDIRIRATKIFDPSERRETQTGLLDAVLPLKVRANAALALSVEPAQIIDFNTPASIKIAGTQSSATYQLYIRSIPDQDFVRQAKPGAEVITVVVVKEPVVQVRTPPRGAVWVAPEGFSAWGEAQPGSGGELQLPTGALTDDSLLIVKAEKMHQVDQDAQTLPSAVQLEQTAAILVRPNPAPPLRLRAWVGATATNGDLAISGGQPGVFYSIRRDQAGADRGLPAYFHKRDAQDPRLNKGLDQLAIEVDFVVARPWPSSMAGADPAETAPQSPLLAAGPLPLDTPLSIYAVKAQTRVAIALGASPQIAAGPEAVPDKDAIAYGASTQIRIKATRTGETYQLMLNGKLLGQPKTGASGQDRLLDTGALTEDTAFEILATPPESLATSAATPIVERVLTATVLVRPNPALQASASQALVEYNTATMIQIDASQPGVNYQLLAGKKPVGKPVAGTGDTIALPTGLLTTGTTFGIRATKNANPSLFADLEQQISVQVQPEAQAT
jgi:hypothetical protein